MRNHQNNPKKAWGPRRTPFGPEPPMPGHDGTCIVCCKGTDTGLIFRSRYAQAGLETLGMPDWQALGTLMSAREDRQYANNTENEIIILRMCESCAPIVRRKVGGASTGVVVPYYRVES